MFGIQHYGTFIAAVLVFQLIPGAGTIAILSSTAKDGRFSGAMAVFGTLTGDFIFMSLAAAGVAQIISASPTFFRTLQIGVSLYLVWMGINLLRESFKSSEDHVESSRKPFQHFRKAMAVSLSNPKVMLFFVTFFPLFLPNHPRNSTILWMMVHVTVLSASYQLLLVWAGNAVSKKLSAVSNARKIAQRVAGVLLISFGVKLARSVI